MKQPTLGILGGLGPMSSVYFYELLTTHTRAEQDSDHLNLLLSSRADTPDRTAFIVGQSEQNPLHTMVREAKRLESAGADLLAIPCNTAHYFYDGICRELSIPVINIIEETASFCAFCGFSRLGLLATEGTVRSRAYESVFEPMGLTCVNCEQADQDIISHLIYGQIKQGKQPDLKAFSQVTDHLRQQGCDALILGCTELSLLKRDHLRDEGLIDSLEVLARTAIFRCGKEAQGFDPSLMRYCSPQGSLTH